MWYQCNTVVRISIHALLAESDGILGRRLWHRQQFLSTLSLRRATHSTGSRGYLHPDFYPRSPCGERHTAANEAAKTANISIHALLAESDCNYGGDKS